MLPEVCDLACGDEEEVKAVMRSSRLPTWERDYAFYLNHKAGLNDVMEGVDVKIAKRQKLAEDRILDELKCKEKARAKATQSKVANEEEVATAVK